MPKRRRDPTSAWQQAATGDHMPFPPPHELPATEIVKRSFLVDDVTWVAWVAGRGVGGTGAYNLALVEALHFATEPDSATPLREALVAKGTFESADDGTLRALLARATPIVTRERD